MKRRMYNHKIETIYEKFPILSNSTQSDITAGRTTSDVTLITTVNGRDINLMYVIAKKNLWSI